MQDFIAEILGRGIKPGLQRVRAGLKVLGNPHLQAPVILVAGTNGKGTTAKLIETMARKLGRQTFLFTSPHLIRLEERYRFNGAQVDAEDLNRCHRRCLQALPGGETDAGPLSPFEWITVVGFELAAARGADLWVLEVGLGGRWDATNCTEPIVSVIASLGLDHMDRLGPDLATIAAEKAGVLRPGRPGILGESVAPWIEGADLRVEGRDFSVEGGAGGAPLKYSSAMGVVQVPNHTPPDPAVRANLAVACAAVEAWARPSEGEFSLLLRAALKSQWPGRCQVIGEEPIVVVDGAHNPDGARWLARCLETRFPGTKFRCIFGAKADKDWPGVIEALSPVLKDLRLIRDRAARLMDPSAMASELRGKTHLSFCEADETLASLLGNAIEPTLVAGSLLLIGEVFTDLGIEDSLIQLD